MATPTISILLVDDDLYIRDLYKEVLESEGFVVDIAVDGKEGLEKILSQEYSLILLDVMLPQLDGIGVLANLAEEKKQHAPVLLLTNLAHDPILREADKYGALKTLIKTDITPDQLIEHVKAVLGIPTNKPAAEMTHEPVSEAVATDTTVAPTAVAPVQESPNAGISENIDTAA